MTNSQFNRQTTRDVTLDRSIEVAEPARSIANVRRLRLSRRFPTRLKALVYRDRQYQTTTVVDISRTGAGLEGAFGLIEGDAVVLSLLDGRTIGAKVAWWAGGRCGLAFLQDLAENDPLLVAARNGHRMPVEPSAAVESANLRLQSTVQDVPGGHIVRQVLSRIRAAQTAKQVRYSHVLLERAIRENGCSFLVDETGGPAGVET